LLQSAENKSTHSNPQSEAWGMLRVDTEWRFLPRFKNGGVAPSNVSKELESISEIFGQIPKFRNPTIPQSVIYLFARDQSFFYSESG
jgi:hypothetical protein